MDARAVESKTGRVPLIDNQRLLGHPSGVAALAQAFKRLFLFGRAEVVAKVRKAVSNHEDPFQAIPVGPEHVVVQSASTVRHEKQRGYLDCAFAALRAGKSTRIEEL